MLLLALVLPALTGCASAARQADRHFFAGEDVEAVSAYQRYLETLPSGESRARAIYRLAVMQASPESPVYDPSAARTLLEGLARPAPDGPYAREAQLVLDVHQQVEHLTAEIANREGRVERLSAEVAALERRLATLAGDVAEREKELTDLGEELARRARETGRLRQEIASRDAAVSRLEQELQQLKDIDLRRRP